MREETTLLPATPLPPRISPYHDAISDALQLRQRAHPIALAELEREQAQTLGTLAHLLIATLRVGHKVLVAGNGGSAAQAQHFAAELVGRFVRERAPYAVLALTTDSAILTAVANDYGYADVFARQVRALGQTGDIFMAFSTSGESDNLIRAAAAARRRGLAVAAITGPRESRLARGADLAVRAPGMDTAAVQELHLILTHILCDVVERELAACTGEAQP